jgi:hypothetical protein
MMKKIVIQGIMAGLLAGIAGAIYFTIYQNTLGTNFGKIVNIPSILGSSVFGSLLIACGYALLLGLNKIKWAGWYQVFVSVTSFATITGPISISLPLSVQNPELFPGLVIPMHFFPALAFFTLMPFFKQNE